MDQTKELGTASVGRLLFRLSLPAIVAQLINALYNIVDRIYLGHIEGIGAMALTGVGVTFPIITLIAAFAALIGMGGAPIMSIYLGEQDAKGAQDILSNCFKLLIGISIVLTIVFMIWKRPLLLFFGASKNTIEYANQYISIYLIGTIFVQIALGMNSFINSQGFAKIGMLTVLIGAICNIVLDPIFIFAFHMGVRGAALATIISQGVSAAWVLYFLKGKKVTIPLKWRGCRLKAAIIRRVLSLGVSPFIMQSTESLVLIVLNASLQRYGGVQNGDLYVGAMTIIGSIMQIAMMPIYGLTQGAQPIIGYNYGAKQYARSKKAIFLLVTSCVSFTVFIWGLIMLFPQFFIGLFNNNPALTNVTVWAIRIYMGMIFMMGFQTSFQNSFLALGQARISLLLALFRKILLLIPLALILPIFMTNKVFGVFLAEPIADFLAATMTTIIFFANYRRLLGEKSTSVK